MQEEFVDLAALLKMTDFPVLKIIIFPREKTFCKLDAQAVLMPLPSKLKEPEGERERNW